MTTALPTYHAEKILLCADRVQRAQWAMREWAELAKTCVDFFEGRQRAPHDQSCADGRKRVGADRARGTGRGGRANRALGCVLRRA